MNAGLPHVFRLAALLNSFIRYPHSLSAGLPLNSYDSCLYFTHKPGPRNQKGATLIGVTPGTSGKRG